MEDPRFGVWNVLQDGEITALGREEPTTLVIFVTIPYLRERIEPLGDSLCLRLRGCRRLEFAGAGAQSSTSPREIAMQRLWILSTDSEAMPVKIVTPSGFLILDFDAVDISLDTGQPLTYDELCRVCGEYWDEWSARGKA